MAVIVVEYRLVQDREGLGVSNLIIFLHLSLKMRIMEMVFEAEIARWEVAIEIGLEMVKVMFEMVVIDH